MGAAFLAQKGKEATLLDFLGHIFGSNKFRLHSGIKHMRRTNGFSCQHSADHCL